ncbi:MAG: hypothetical protein KatS3mg087_0794 [Patescibacteria group bacterium]|nr:MAG: hypothetical protein KatS3mg087_0794 [Patescibacteria group bacterium]
MEGPVGTGDFGGGDCGGCGNLGRGDRAVPDAEGVFFATNGERESDYGERGRDTWANVSYRGRFCIIGV